jgi:hypothetical protein
MPKAPLTVQIKDAYKDGVVFYKEATSITLLDFVSVYGQSGQILSYINEETSAFDFTSLEFSLVSGFPLGYTLTGSRNHLSTDQTEMPVPAVDVFNGTLETSASAITGTYNCIIKVTLQGHSHPIEYDGGNFITNYTILTNIAATYFPLKIIVEDAPTFGPKIYISGDLGELTTVFGTASDTTSFTVGGEYLTAPITVTVPNGFQVSRNSSNNFGGSVTVGELAETTLYLRLSPSAAPATYSGNINITSTGATSKTLATISSTIDKLPQTIGLFSSISNKTTNDVPFAVTAPTASSGLPVSLSVKSGPATISGNTVTITGVGTVVLAANQAGNTNYHAAAEVTTSFIVTAVAAPSAVIRNGDLLMDVGVTQNIKVTFNSVYQTIYTRVTGLPAGMRYTGSPDGFLSGFIGGTPLASGTYNVTIATSYKTSETSETINTTKTIVYTVNEAGDPAILLSNQNLTVGTSVNIALRASDVSAVLAWSATGLPAGLVCGTGTSAAITGTPTTAGTSTSTVTLSCRKINSTETTTVTKPVTFTVT